MLGRAGAAGHLLADALGEGEGQQPGAGQLGGGDAVGALIPPHEPGPALTLPRQPEDLPSQRQLRRHALQVIETCGPPPAPPISAVSFGVVCSLPLPRLQRLRARMPLRRNFQQPTASPHLRAVCRWCPPIQHCRAGGEVIDQVPGRPQSRDTAPRRHCQVRQTEIRPCSP